MENDSKIKLLEPKGVLIGNVLLPVKLTFRAMIEFEELSGVPVQFAVTTEQVSMLFYCAAKAGARSVNVDFEFDYEGFLDFVDEHPDSLQGFYEAIKEDENPVEKKKVTKKSSST